MRLRAALPVIALLAAAVGSCSGGGGGDGITVTLHVATVVVSPGSANIFTNATTQLTAETLDGSGNPMTGRQVTWSSSNSGVATVSDGGLVTGVGPGVATITATSEGRSGTSAITVTSQSFALTVTGAGTGSGTVTAPPAGGQGALSCTITAGSGTCNGLYPGGTVVTLTATPANGLTFAGWSGACSGAGACQLTMNQAQNVIATFTGVTIATSASPTNGGTTSGGGAFALNSSVTVTATANAGFGFFNWTEGANVVSTNASYTFTATTNRTLVANFVSGAFALTLTGGGTGNGTVTVPAVGGQAQLTCASAAGTVSGTCTGTYAAGTTVVLSAAAAIGGSTFTAWGGACAGTAVGASCTLAMNAARAVSVTFTAPAVDPCAPVALAFPGVVNGTLTNLSCATGTFPASQNPSIVYRFTASGTTATSFAIGPTTLVKPSLEVMFDPPSGTNNIVWVPAANSSTVSMTYLLPGGTYQARIQSQPPGGTGTFTLTGTATALSNTGCTTRTLLVSVTLSTQSLAATDCQWGVDNTGTVDNTFFDRYAVYSTKACTITMDSPVLNTYLEIRDAITGAFVAKNDDFTGTNSYIGLLACNNGGDPLYIFANSSTATPATGGYTLTFAITGGGSIIDGARATAPILYPNAWQGAIRSPAGPATTKKR